jgi:hypothetical protein
MSGSGVPWWLGATYRRGDDQRASWPPVVSLLTVHFAHLLAKHPATHRITGTGGPCTHPRGIARAHEDPHREYSP